MGSPHDDPDGAAVAVAAMLLGSLAFMMSLFYFVNFNDRDIQR